MSSEDMIQIALTHSYRCPSSGHPEYRVKIKYTYLPAALEHPDGLAGDRPEPYGYPENGAERAV